MSDGRVAEDVIADLRQHSWREDDDIAEEMGMLEAGGFRLAYLMIQPHRAASRRSALVICHSWFEFKMLQSSEIALARAVARAGFPAIYIQAPGMGDSSGEATDCTIEARVAAALRAAQELLSRTESSDQICFFGSRLGAAVAARAAREFGSSSTLVMWDPALKASEYWKQAKRFARVVATLGPRTRPFATPDESLTSTGEASFLGYQITQRMLDDLRSIDLIADGAKITGPALVLSLNDQMVSAARRAVSGFVGDVDGVSLGRPHPRHLIHMGVKEAKDSIEATVDWMERRLS